jgi:hypothetical protein
MIEYQKKPLPAKVTTIGIALLVIGAIGIGAAFMVDADRALFNYLIMYMFILSIGLGSLGLVGMEYLVGATWSTPFRRVSEFLSSVLPLMIILVIPILLGMHDLFHWTHHEAVEHDPILQSKEPYLNVPFFIVRVGICYAIWMLFYFVFMRNSRKQDTTGDPRLTKISVRFSAPFAFLFMITATIAAVDFMMSLEPHWFSTMFGVYYFAGTILSSFAALTFISIMLKQNGYLSPKISNSHFYSLGTLLFGFTVFWAYIGFSQFMLIWYADIPEETFWYMLRFRGDWEYVSYGLLVLHFIIPFIVLLPRTVKTNIGRLKFMSIWILVMHYYDLYWIIMPTYANTHDGMGPVFGWMELVFPMAAAGLLILVFALQAKRQNLMPIGDPKLESGLNFHLY